MSLESYKEFESYLNSISPTFCAAKWVQVTMHLHNGHTHSCHHVRTHRVPLEELKANPLALHNTSIKKQARKQMLGGEIVEECQFCNLIEKSKRDNVFSDRVTKSLQIWAKPYIEDIIKLPWDADYFPTYVEVSFGDQCNFKCSYCSPTTSSKWFAESKHYGGYPTGSNFNDLRNFKGKRNLPEKSNPYIKAFWKIFPEMYGKLIQLRITGGEPILNKNTFKVIDHIIANPAKDLTFAVNSNMCVPGRLMNTFLEKMKIVAGNVKALWIHTSCEAHGERANYIRHGLDFNQWLENVDRFLQEIPTLEINFMATYNALSVTSFTKFLEDLLKLKLRYPKRTFLDVPILHHPQHQRAHILTKDFLGYIEDSVTFMYRNLQQPSWEKLVWKGFFEAEAMKMQRNYFGIKQIFDSPDSEIPKHRKDFFKFFSEHDVRRGTDFLKTFPEMADFFAHCSRI